MNLLAEKLKKPGKHVLLKPPQGSKRNSPPGHLDNRKKV